MKLRQSYRDELIPVHREIRWGMILDGSYPNMLTKIFGDRMNILIKKGVPFAIQIKEEKTSLVAGVPDVNNYTIFRQTLDIAYKDILTHIHNGELRNTPDKIDLSVKNIVHYGYAHWDKVVGIHQYDIESAVKDNVKGKVVKSNFVLIAHPSEYGEQKYLDNLIRFLCIARPNNNIEVFSYVPVQLKSGEPEDKSVNN